MQYQATSPSKFIHRLVADRAGRGHLVRPFAAFARVHDGADDVRDHVSRAFDHHAVADTDVLFGDVVEVMQGGLFDDHAADLDRLQDGVRRQHACAPHVHADIVQDRGHFLCGEFQRQRAARIFAHEPQLIRQVQIIQLDHHAIYFEGDLCPHALPLARAGQHFLHVEQRFDKSETGKPRRLRYISVSHCVFMGL